MGLIVPYLVTFISCYNVSAFIPQGMHEVSRSNYIHGMSMVDENSHNSPDLLKGLRSLTISAIIGASLIVNPVDAASSGGRGNSIQKIYTLV